MLCSSKKIVAYEHAFRALYVLTLIRKGKKMKTNVIIKYCKMNIYAVASFSHFAHRQVS